MAINTHNGTVRWSRTFPASPTMAVQPQSTLLGGLLYVNAYVGFNIGSPTQPKVLYGLDPANGAIKNTLNLPATTSLDTATFDGNVLYYMNGVSENSGTFVEVYAVQLPGGKHLWHASITVKNALVVNGPYVHDGVVYVAFHILNAYDLIARFNSQTGKDLGNFLVPTSGNGLRPDPAFIGNMIYCPSTDGAIYVLDVHTGKLIWKQPFDASIALATSDVLYLHTSMSIHVTDLYTDLVALRAKDGAILWHFSVPGFYFGYGRNIGDVDGVLYDLGLDNNGGSNNAAIYAVRASDGKPLWHLPVPGQEVLIA